MRDHLGSKVLIEKYRPCMPPSGFYGKNDNFSYIVVQYLYVKLNYILLREPMFLSLIHDPILLTANVFFDEFQCHRCICQLIIIHLFNLLFAHKKGAINR